MLGRRYDVECDHGYAAAFVRKHNVIPSSPRSGVQIKEGSVGFGRGTSRIGNAIQDRRCRIKRALNPLDFRRDRVVNLDARYR